MIFIVKEFMIKNFSPFNEVKKLPHVSVVFLFNKKKEVLLQHRDNNINIESPNVWGPVGGHCVKNESPYKCALREMKEETGYICGEIYWDENYFFHFNSKKEHVVSVFWSIYDEIQNIKCFEGQSIKFVSISGLKNYKIHKQNISIINKNYKNIEYLFNLS